MAAHPPASTPSDPFALLEQDHRELERLIDELSGASDDRRQELLGTLQKTLSVHFDFEESEIYPLVARLVGAPQADDRHTEDEAVRQAVAAFAAFAESPDGGRPGDALTDVRNTVDRHIRIEAELFPTLREQVGPGEQEHLSAALLALREAAR